MPPVTWVNTEQPIVSAGDKPKSRSKCQRCLDWFPRQVLPGTTYLVTRRCAQRQFLLRPSAATNGVFLYVLAVGGAPLRRQGPCLLRPLEPLPPRRHRPGCAPPRLRAVPRLARRARAQRLARPLGVVLGADELQRRRAHQPPWTYSTRLPTCSRTRSRPGSSAADASGPGSGPIPTRSAAAPIEARRPADLLPAERKDAGDDGARANPTSRLLLRGGVQRPALRGARGARAAGRARARIRGPGVPWRGARAGAEATRSPGDRGAERKLNPRVAARDKWKRIEALGRLAEFVEAYRAAWTRLKAGIRDVLFPAGTYWLRVAHGARCLAPG